MARVGFRLRQKIPQSQDLLVLDFLVYELLQTDFPRRVFLRQSYVPADHISKLSL